MKYEINKDFKYISCLTFPLIKEAAPAAEAVLGVFMNVNHSDGMVNVRRMEIDVACGGIKALLYEPKGCKGSLPLLVYYHGGGFVYKAAPYHFRLVKEYCVRASCKVLMVDYRLAPKNPFPIPLKDCYAALRWVINNSDMIGADQSKIAIGGDSAGGNLAAGVALMARDNELIKPCGQMLIYPVTDRRMNTLSMKKYTDTPIWNAVLSKKMWQIYLPSAGADSIEYASPIEAEDLSGLPPAYIETAEFDSLHDEGVMYAQALQTAGNPVELNETKGTIHGFEMAEKSKITANSVQRRVAFLKRVFA